MRRRRGPAARALLGLVAVTGAAWAQPAPPPYGAPQYGTPPYAPRYGPPYAPAPSIGASAPAPAAPPQPVETPAERERAARVADANADHVVVMPTAYTHPKGTFYASSYDIVLLQAGYAFSDATQLSLTATPPLGADHIFPADLSVKARVIGEPAFRLAFLGSASGISGLKEGPMFVGRAGVVAQFCFDAACRASVSVASNLLLGGPAMLATNGVGAIVPATHWLSLLFEAETLLPLGREVGPYNGIAVAPGVRFPFKNWALDLSVAYLVSGSDSTRVTVPLLTFTYRFLP